MKPVLQIKLGQQLNMTPQLQQAIRLLQLSSVELESEIQALLDANPLLESGDDKETNPLSRFEEVILSSAASPETDALDGLWEPFCAAQTQLHPETTVDTQWADISEPSPQNSSSNSSTPLDYDWESRQGGDSLRDHLTWQKELTPFNPTEFAIATAIIDAINEDGYLTCPLTELLNNFDPESVSFSQIEQVLKRVQGFEPLGVGARDLQECLLLQVQQLSATTQGLSQAKSLITEHLDLLARKQYTRLKSRLKITEHELQVTIKLLQSLNPRPGSVFYNTRSEFIVPDVLVQKQIDGFKVELNNNFVPRVRINPSYAALIRRADTGRDNQYLKDQLTEARWLVKSLKNRQETLLLVSQCIVEQQIGFFQQGPEAMKPMILQDIARITGLHESTISRITTQKYMLTPHGIFELKYFFSSQLTTQTGAEFSSTAIRALIKKLIQNEVSKKPLSDQTIASLLATRGITIARRTVAKYREAMAIPPSNERKQFL